MNGEYVPRKSILKSRSRENSVCSDTSENSAAEFDDRRGVQRSISCDEATQSDNSEGILEEEEEAGQQQLPKKLPASSGTTEVQFLINYWSLAGIKMRNPKNIVAYTNGLFDFFKMIF